MAVRSQGRNRSGPESVSEGGDRIVYPCSREQTRFWYEERFTPGSPSRNVFARWRLEGDIPPAILEEAWRTIVGRHEALRTSFVEEDGVPLQVVASFVPFSLLDVDLTLLTEQQSAAEAERIASVEAQTPFDLSVAPLIRVTHVRQRERVSILMMTAHHAVCDGWSVGILARELGESAAALRAGRQPALAVAPLTYGAYSERQRDMLAGEAFAAERQELERKLSGYRRFELIPDFPRPASASWRGDIASVLMPRTLTDALAALARDHGCTLFMAAYAVLLVLLGRHSGEDDLTISTQVAGRDDVDLERVVGTFVNTIALRTSLEGDPAFSDLLERARDTVSDAFETRTVPTDVLVEIVNPPRDLSRSTLFSINFVFQRSFVKNAVYDGFALVDLPSRSAGTTYDLCFFMVERPEGWRISCEYNVALFAKATVDRLLERFTGLIAAATSDPSAAISELPLTTRGDAIECGALDGSVAAQPPASLLHERFEEQARRTPGATAALAGDVSLTYAALDAAANRLARELYERGYAGRGRRVGVVLERSTNLIVALLAILKSGAAYVPFEPRCIGDEGPRARIAALDAVVTTAQLAGLLGSVAPAALLIDRQAERMDAPDSRSLASEVAPSDAACVLSVSDAPSGVRDVVYTHGALASVLHAMCDLPGFDANDTVVGATSAADGTSLFDLILPLLVGGRLVLAHERECDDAAALVSLLRRSRATSMAGPPALWRRMLEAGWTSDLALRAICTSAPDLELGAALLSTASECWTLYGPAQATLCATAMRLDEPADVVAIGAPLAGVRLSVLDRNGTPLPPGIPGKLCIAGDGIAGGALRTGDDVRVRAGRVELIARGPAARYTGDRPDPAPVVSVPEHDGARALDTRARIHGMIAALLGNDAFAFDDDLFTRGFHSLLALRLIARIKTELHVELPLRSLFDDPTVDALARMIDVAQAASALAPREHEASVAYNAEGTRRPLHFFHSDLFADGLYCRRLTAALPDQPVFAIAPHGTAGLPLVGSIEDMARDYGALVKELQPEGPYRFGGYCASGLVAYELARQFRERGETVDRVVMINASALPSRSIPAFDRLMRAVGTNRSIPARLRTNLCYNIARLHAALAGGAFSALRFLVKLPFAVIKRRGSDGVEVEGEPFKARRSENDVRNSFAHITAAFTYHPKPYPGPVSLIWGEGQSTSADVPLRAWQRLARRVEVITTAGGHVNLLDEQAEELARAMRRALAD